MSDAPQAPIEKIVPAHVEQRMHTSDGKEYKLDHRVTSIVFVDEDRILCGSQDHSLSLWQISSSTRLAQFTTKQMHDATCVAASPNGKFAASSHGSWGAVKLWELATGTLLHELAGSAMYVRTVSFSPDSAKLFAMKGGAAWVWNTETGATIKEPKDDHGASLHAAVALDGLTCVRHTKSGPVLATFPALKKKFALGATPEDVEAIAYTNDGKRVAYGDKGGTLRVHDTSDGRVLASIDGTGSFDDRIESIAIHGDHVWWGDGEGRVSHLVVGGPSPTPQRWEADRMGIEAIAISPSGKRVAIGTYAGEVKLIAHP